MIIQDFIIGAVSLLFVYAMYEQIVLNKKLDKVLISRKTIRSTIIACFVISGCLFTLDLWYSSIVNAIVAVMWLVVDFQKSKKEKTNA